MFQFLLCPTISLSFNYNVGKYPLYVSNTFNVTKLHINDDLSEIIQLQDVITNTITFF